MSTSDPQAKLTITIAPTLGANTLLRAHMKKQTYVMHAALAVMGQLNVTISKLDNGDWDIHCTLPEGKEPAIINSLMGTPEEVGIVLPDELRPLTYYTVYMSALKYLEQKLQAAYLPKADDAVAVVGESDVPPPPKAQA